MLALQDSADCYPAESCKDRTRAVNEKATSRILSFYDCPIWKILSMQCVFTENCKLFETIFVY